MSLQPLWPCILSFLHPTVPLMERSNGAWGNGTSWVATTAGHSCPGHGRVQGGQRKGQAQGNK